MAQIKAQPNRKLAREVQELLDIPVGRPPSIKPGTDILKAVLQTIKDALIRGESVYIRGFGTFKVVKRQPHPTPHNIITRKGPNKTYTDVIQHYHPRHYVIFQPSLPLLAMLNLPEDGHEPNYKERRAQGRWCSPSEVP